MRRQRAKLPPWNWHAGATDKDYFAEHCEIVQYSAAELLSGLAGGLKHQNGHFANGAKRWLIFANGRQVMVD